MAAREQAGTPGTQKSGAQASSGQPSSRTTAEDRRAPAPRNRLGWIAITVAGALTAWQIVYAITLPSVQNVETYESVGVLLTLVLAVGAAVLGIVALSQRVRPRWPGLAALAVGTYAFIVAVASWIGRLMY